LTAAFELKDIHPSDIRNNKLQLNDRSFHDWYRFVLSFPPHLVRYYLDMFDIDSNMSVLDPFCGTGTTIIEAKKNLICSYGLEANPMAAFASTVKSNWKNQFKRIREIANAVIARAHQLSDNISGDYLTFSDDQKSVVLKNSISPKPLHKCLILLKCINSIDDVEIKNLFLLALSDIAVHVASNLKFGPEVGVSRNKKSDADVFESFHKKIVLMASDLESVEGVNAPLSTILRVDARNINRYIPYDSIDAVITSPPYPNEKDYTRTTRLESVLLGFINCKSDLRQLKQNLIRSNTRNVYVKDTDDNYISKGSSVDKIANEIERRRIALDKTSGFERLYHRVTRLYFGGMKRHLNDLKPYLRSGAKLAYVVGDQASYLQVLIRTGELLAEIAEEVGYKIVDLELFRTRLSTTTGTQLREEVLILEWNPKRRNHMAKKKNRYDQLIEKVFFEHYKAGDTEIEFNRDEFEPISKDLNIKLPKNLGDIVYSYRYRNSLPKRINSLLKNGEEWIIRSVGRGRYRFSKSALGRISPNLRLSKIKILDSTPEIIRRYALNDEQALLAILRYNRLIDTFLEITCYPLQSHLRTTVPQMGQVETDELYVGISKKGAQYVIPVQAKGKTDLLGVVQIEQDFAIGASKFPVLVCRPVAAQFIEDDLIALFEFEKNEGEITIKDEKHYRIVANPDLSDDEIKAYKENDLA